MKKHFSIAGILLFLGSLNTGLQAQSISGFNEKNTARQLEVESKFDQLLSNVAIGETIKELSSKPHHLGSARGKEVAEYIKSKFTAWGLDAKIETYQVLFPTPKSRVLEMTSPTSYRALLKEPAFKEDATSGQQDQLPTYNAWSADGDVTGELVFVNYGLPEDYETLASLGIDVDGKIVIAKYGRSWRGIKPKIAQEHGAIGCIIYSDPRDDGYARGDVYPKGAYKNEFGVQRGSIMDMVIYPGDPLTPGVGATEKAERLDRLKAPNLLKIPVLPISYHDAQPLLAALEGTVAPGDWAGGLPITYHIGPGKTRVHLKVAFDWKLVPAFNVIGMIKGAEAPDEWVIRGNHHDAWVNGANDPISGMAALMEEAKALGTLTKGGWKPKRTMVFCAWDGEEPGLLGSTEWVEDHEDELKKKGVVYINSDSNGRGFLDADGSHALETLMYEVAKGVVDPKTKVSVYERQKSQRAISASGAKAKKDELNKKELNLGALGSGSDYSSFLQHVGVPVLNLGFGGEDNGGEYHSIYDSYDDYTRFKDPTFEYGVALSKVAGRAALRMANADVLPFDFRSLHKTIEGYVSNLTSQLDQMRESTSVENRLVKESHYTLASDPTKTYKAPLAKAEVPYLDFSALQNALLALGKSCEQLNTLWQKAIASGNASTLNSKLYQAEQQLLSKEGLPRRSWYKHTLYAPGFYTGYGVKTMPGIREAIEQRDWKEAQEQIAVDAAAINRLAEYFSAIQ
jgi:N-acetylated-alpha-linked acidic dipeptidase